MPVGSAPSAVPPQGTACGHGHLWGWGWEKMPWRKGITWRVCLFSFSFSPLHPPPLIWKNLGRWTPQRSAPRLCVPTAVLSRVWGDLNAFRASGAALGAVLVDVGQCRDAPPHANPISKWETPSGGGGNQQSSVCGGSAGGCLPDCLWL